MNEEGGTPPKRLRELLPRSHLAFLGSFARPTPVQLGGVPAILEGRDTLLSAPTASGKTEAYAAPTAELLLASPRRPLSQLVVSPTRALANDLKRRLEAPMDTAGISFGRHTGEHKERSGGALPEVVVVTPEALDSLLARRPGVLRDVRAVVLDEIHVLDGAPRGDQLRVLLARLEEIATQRPQRIAASATVEHPVELAARYLKDAAIIDAGGGRAIRARSFAGSGAASLAAHLTELAGAGARKVLVFCNRRRDVDRLAGELGGRTPFGAAVFAHHGSLSRNVRERTERQFLAAPAAVAVATLTLELGIDIGTVDYVLLAAPPTSVSSLLQRIGRGGRRGDTTRVGFAWADRGEELVYRTLLRCATKQRLCEPPYFFKPGVLVQQALVLAGGRGHVSARRLEEVVPATIRTDLPEGFAAAILDEMVAAELLERPRGGRYVLAERQEQLYDLGKIHSNFATPPGISIVNRLTGDVIGELDPRLTSRSRTRLGGGSWQPVRELEGRILADESRGGEAALYATSESPLASLPFAREVAAALGAGSAEWLQRPVGDRWVLLHGLGTLGGLVLAATLRSRLGAGRVGKPTAFTLELARPLEAPVLLGARELEGFVAKHEARLARACGMGSYHRVLPEGIRRAAVHRALDPNRLTALLEKVQLRSSGVEEEREAVWEFL